MPLVTFRPGQSEVQPGEYIRIVNASPPGATPTLQPIVAILAQFDQGPLNTPTLVSDPVTLALIFGTGGGYPVCRNALAAGAPQLLITRVGSGGTVAAWTFKLSDGTTAAVSLPVASAGVAANGYSATIVDSLYNTAQRIFRLYNGLTEVAAIVFAKAPTTVGGHGEAGALVAALNAAGLGAYLGTAAVAAASVGTTTALASNSTTLTYTVANSLAVGQTVTVTGATPAAYNGTFVVATASGTQFTVTSSANPGAGTVQGVVTSLPADTSTLAAVTSVVPTTVGVDPTVSNSSYTAALTTIQQQAWTYLITDSVDQSLAASIVAFINHQRASGSFQYAVLGEPTSVARATREADATGFNNIAITYVGNGFTDANGSEQGANAVGTYAGMRAAAAYNDSQTGQVVPGALPGLSKLLDPLVESADRDAAIQAGMLIFHDNALGQAKVLYDINSFVVPNGTYHQGWRYNTVVQIYDHLLSSIAIAWDQLANLRNNVGGRVTVMQAAQRVLNQMILEGSIENDGQATISEDPANPPSSDSAWFIISANVTYPLTKIYLSAQFAYSNTAG